MWKMPRSCTEAGGGVGDGVGDTEQPSSLASRRDVSRASACPRASASLPGKGHFRSDAHLARCSASASGPQQGRCLPSLCPILLRSPRTDTHQACGPHVPGVVPASLAVAGAPEEGRSGRLDPHAIRLPSPPPPPLLGPSASTRHHPGGGPRGGNRPPQQQGQDPASLGLSLPPPPRQHAWSPGASRGPARGD